MTVSHTLGRAAGSVRSKLASSLPRRRFLQTDLHRAATDQQREFIAGDLHRCIVSRAGKPRHEFVTRARHLASQDEARAQDERHAKQRVGT